MSKYLKLIKIMISLFWDVCNINIILGDGIFDKMSSGEVINIIWQDI